MSRFKPDAVDTYGSKYIWLEGYHVERDALHVAEKVHEYDPRLRVQFLEQAVGVGDPPFRVMELCNDGIERPLFYFWKLDDSVLERIHKADTTKWDIQERIEKTNRQAKERQSKYSRDVFDEVKDIVASVIRSPKDTYSVKDPWSGQKKVFRA